MTARKTEPEKSKADVPMTRTERRQQRTRAALISALRRLVAEKGVEAVTIREIADSADIAIGSFYSYFDTKEDLLREAIREILFEAGEFIDSMNAESEDPLEVMATAFTNFERIVRDDPLLAWFIVRVGAHDPAVMDNMTQRFVRDLQKGVDNGTFRLPHLPTVLTVVNGSFLDFFRERLKGTRDPSTVVHFVHLMLRLLGADDKAARKAAKKAWKQFGVT